MIERSHSLPGTVKGFLKVKLQGNIIARKDFGRLKQPLRAKDSIADSCCAGAGLQDEELLVRLSPKVPLPEDHCGGSFLIRHHTPLFRDVPTTEIENGVSSLWWSSLVSDFTTLAPNELPDGVHAGVSYTTVTLNVPSYLNFLLEKIKTYGGRIIRKRLPDDGGLIVALATARNAASVGEEDVFAYVNATGISARKLVPDNKVFPVRGQTVLVKGEAKVLRTRIQNRSGKIKYVITRSGSSTTVLGGTREDGVW